MQLRYRRNRNLHGLPIPATLAAILCIVAGFAYAKAPLAPAAQETALQVGTPAPDFDLPDQNGVRHHLADLRGKTVVLAFYPADMTVGCTAEMCSIRDNISTLQHEGATIFGVSVQDVTSKKAFADKYQFQFPLLADADKSVARAYGVLNERGVANRVTFIIGPDGKIQYIDRALRFDRQPTGIVSYHAATLAMALDGNWRAELGKPVPSFSLKNYDGASIVSTDATSKATVIMFISTQCPVSNAYNGRMEALAQTYGPKAVRVLAINANAGETPDQIASHANEHGFTFPVLKDSTDAIADRFNAQHTPEVWVLDGRGIARYHGAIDDSQEESAIKSHYLADAIDAVLAGKDPSPALTRAFGCAIRRVRHNG